MTANLAVYFAQQKSALPFFARLPDQTKNYVFLTD